MFYPSLYWNLYMNRDSERRWYDRITGHIILGALPRKAMLEELCKTEKVSIMINTVREWKGLPKQYAQLGLEQHYVPMIDFVPPSLGDIESCVNKMAECIDAGKTVYVHCKAGRGRSATVVICYLIKHKGMGPSEANEFLISKRPQVISELHTRPVIQEFYGIYGTRQSEPDS